jgi:hypothetical protein
MEMGILMLRLHRLMTNGAVVLIVCGQRHTLLHDGFDGVVLQVEQVLHVLGHRSHVNIEVQDLEVRHGLKALLPHGIFLNPNQERCDRHRGGSGDVTLTQRGEWDVCCLLDGGVRLITDGGSHPWLHRVEEYHHTSFAHVQAVNHRQATMVDRNFPILTKMEECVI